MMLNAFTTDGGILARSGAKDCDRIFYAGEGRSDDPRVTHFVRAGGERRPSDGCYLPDLSDGDAVDDAIDAFSYGRPLILSACATLEEVGTFDKKYGMTPIAYAHSCGLLGQGSFVSGCVYLDKDDIELIVSSGARVILTPSDSLGRGCGIPPLRMLHTLGAAVSLGTGSGAFNTEADLVFEKRLICLAASGILCTPDPVPKDFADSMLRSDGVFLPAKALRDE